ncbi:SDR family NAD(P)-dependent oxidoreductase [Bradyrhizobium sp. AUGA SZCCT0160]|uniref:SDR family NAD(P)-dependent oxidoreductase n=1 Tax=Bradyrhizobium sp. AUGA SZCCT0160 TaxID=2807662 RepID=UPI00390C972E
MDLPLNKWRATIDIGLTGTFLMGQAFARRMVSARRKGAVVNLSCVSAFHPYGGSGAYSTVKAAIIHLSELMAVVWAPHWIRVNAVAPGTVETPLTANCGCGASTRCSVVASSYCIRHGLPYGRAFQNACRLKIPRASIALHLQRQADDSLGEFGEVTPRLITRGSSQSPAEQVESSEPWRRYRSSRRRSSSRR